MSLTSDSDISLHFSTNINVHKENSGASWSFLCTHAGYIKIELQNSPHLSHCSKNAEQVHMVLTLNSFAQFRKNLFFFLRVFHGKKLDSLSSVPVQNENTWRNLVQQPALIPPETLPGKCFKFRLHQKPIYSNEEHTAQTRDLLQTKLFKCHNYEKKNQCKTQTLFERCMD